MAAPPFKVKALFKYDSGYEGDLNFPDGEILTVTALEDAEWYYGEYVDGSGTKQEGIFPMNFVDRYEPETPPRPARPPRPKKETEPIHSPSIGPEHSPSKSIERRDSTEAAAKEIVPSKSASQSVKIGSNPGKVDQPLSPKSAISADLTQMPRDIQGGVSANKGSPKQSSGTGKGVSSTTPAEKAGGSSFRDRIAAFNKPAAPPVAPFKPGGLSSGSSGFIKKPFVAPPPSKNSYVPIPREPPPQKVYRREEDPGTANRASQDDEHADKALPVMPAQNIGDGEDQPKPTSLKERIALLQKQQLEQAARHAEAALKKEKPKRPPKKRVESHEGAEDQADAGDADLEKVDSAETAVKRSLESSREEGSALGRSSTRRKPSREQSQTDVPAAVARGVTSDADDADQSGAGEDIGETSTGRDDSDEQSRAPAPGAKAPRPPGHGMVVGDNESNGDEEEDEEEEIDPEIRRRMEIRERMAKMSGGMGMHGMFGPPGGVPPIPAGGAKKKKRGTGDPDDAIPGSPQAHAFTVAMALPGLQPKPRSPEHLENRLAVVENGEKPSPLLDAERHIAGVPDTEGVKRDVPSIPPRVEERGPPPPQERPVPPPPPVPIERGAPPPPPVEARPLPPPTPTRPLSPSAGSESDDEMSLYTKGQSISTPTDSGPETRAPPPLLRAGTLPIPSRPDSAENSGSPEGKRASYFSTNPTSPTSPTTPGATRRHSKIPPVPMASPGASSASQTRPPPPPPPSGAPPRRRSTVDDKTMTALTPKHTAPNESEEEVTEYEGDYDTDIAAGATHKDALKAHERESSYDDSTAEENSNRSPAIPPSNVPPPIPHTSAPRAVPPPPPSQPPKPNRQSVDMPRAAPPPIPSPRELQAADRDDEYDPYRYTTSSQSGPVPTFLQAPTAEPEDEDDLYSAPRPRQSQQPPPRQERPHPPPPSVSAPRAPAPASSQPLEIQRVPPTARRSMEQSRTSGERGYIASDIDLGESSYWWTQANTPPPALQNRRDILYEIEESNTSHGGKVTISKDVYVIFHDYSQTVITAQYDARNPADVVLRQRHESPPSTLRQDLLEEAHTRFGQQISEAVVAKQNTVVGNSEPHTLVLELLKQIPDVLYPVGVRAYGALVYANLANASFQQFDEIRAGDIITLRNAKFQGHRGPMHQKYNIEVGKPDHVGIVVDWDGTKKKVRAWEQGRESKKVKIESFKLGDLRSGEVKVWRVMGRSWVGWGAQG
ncbi:hypothetical protein FGG08_001568 [Glutinoglossum americanum]|uniref:SH3 domain-containing protein n=1 Tax=Glutinoglossum americanum TaxID=1670608 RepID=A0A9P8L581_9PEZI|nr:hypothetical protein FGG08_001568 [Glutinoglossum americanum]